VGGWWFQASTPETLERATVTVGSHTTDWFHHFQIYP
jgi:hypothetical protein